jgi:hypothetical protein
MNMEFHALLCCVQLWTDHYVKKIISSSPLASIFKF